MRQPTDKFGPVAIFLHWFIAAGIVVAVVVGLISDYTDDAALTRQTLYIHQSVGVIIFILAVVRLVWRLTHPAPPLPAGTPRSQRVAAAATHALLYLTIFALPVTGYIGLAARGRVISVFDLFDVPRLVPLGLKLSAASQNLHDNGQYVLYMLLALHIGAALYHRFVLKDDILARMWPERRSKTRPRALQGGDVP